MKNFTNAPQSLRDQAVALQYSDADSLPKILASGVGEIAREIVKVAEKNQIPIHQDTDLVQLLSSVGDGQNISPETYRLVAEVICFLYHVDKQWQSTHGFLEQLTPLMLTAPQRTPQRS